MAGWHSWFRIGPEEANVPNGNTVTAVSRNPDHLDLFVVGHNGGIYSAWWHAGQPWSGWFRIGPEEANVPNGNTVTAIARRPDHLDLFVVGHDGGIYSAWWHEGQPWSGWFRIGPPSANVPNGNTVTAVSRNPDHLDLFVVGHNGGIYSAWWHEGVGWSDWFRIGPEAANVPNGNTVTALSRNPDHLDLWVVGHNGGIYSAWWHAGQPWSDWFRIGPEEANVPNTNTVTAVARYPDHLDLWVVGHNGGIYSAWWHEGQPWSDWFRIGPEAANVPNTNTVTALARHPDHLDLFVVGHNGGIYSAWWHAGQPWSDWFRIGPEPANVPNRNTVTPIARFSDHLDLWVVGHNGGIYSTFWPSSGPSYQLDVNVILVGEDNFTDADRTKTAESLAIARSIYANVGLDLREAGWFAISAAEAGSYETIDNDSEAEDLTDDWTVDNDALDLFVVRTMTFADGISPVGGPCDKDAKGMTGPVVSLNGSTDNAGNTFAHEMGHYLGLDHIPDAGNFIGGGGSSNSFTGIYDWQGNIMVGHCFVRPI